MDATEPVRRKAWELAVPLLLPSVRALLQRTLRTPRPLEVWVDVAEGFHETLPFPPRIRKEFALRPLQVRSEILTLLRRLRERPPRSLMEIGTATGGTLFLFARVAAPDAQILSIDLPGGPFGSGYPEWKVPYYRSFAAPGQTVHLLRADSHNPGTRAAVKNLLEGQGLDFLFIDGDHTYEGVKADFEIYRDLVAPGGLVAFHDIVPHPPEMGCEVDRFWSAVKEGWKHDELVEDWDQGHAGIGLLWMPTSPHPAGRSRPRVRSDGDPGGRRLGGELP